MAKNDLKIVWSQIFMLFLELKFWPYCFPHSVVSALRYLTDEEVELAIEAADIVALPYRKAFNGASGPLGEGVCREKCIIGSDHGNLGYTIREHCLGYTFQTENTDDLTRVLDVALATPFVFNDTYMTYKASLNPDLFAANYRKIYEALCK